MEATEGFQEVVAVVAVLEILWALVLVVMVATVLCVSLHSSEEQNNAKTIPA